MSEWLDLMLDEISRKRREAIEAADEERRRMRQAEQKKTQRPDQSK
jgi:hypothetical protein